MALSLRWVQRSILGAGTSPSGKDGHALLLIPYRPHRPLPAGSTAPPPGIGLATCPLPGLPPARAICATRAPSIAPLVRSSAKNAAKLRDTTRRETFWRKRRRATGGGSKRVPSAIRAWRSWPCGGGLEAAGKNPIWGKTAPKARNHWRIGRVFHTAATGPGEKCRFCHQGSLTAKRAAPITRPSLMTAAPNGAKDKSKPLKSKSNFRFQGFGFRIEPKNGNRVLTDENVSNTTRQR